MDKKCFNLNAEIFTFDSKIEISPRLMYRAAVVGIRKLNLKSVFLHLRVHKPLGTLNRMKLYYCLLSNLS